MKALGRAMAKFADLAERKDGTYDRLGELDVPVLVAQGKEDFMIPSCNSYLLFRRFQEHG